MSFDIEPYDPCPCGSGNKYKFCCAASAKANRHGKYPIGTVALYGPDDKVTTKIAASVIVREDAEPILRRWIATGVRDDPAVAREIKLFFALHGVKTVVDTSKNIGCPHEEVIDFPLGQDCPLCPFWAGKQGTAARDEGKDGGWEIDLTGPDEDDNEDGNDAGQEEPARDFDAAFARVEAIIGDRSEDWPEVLFAHLQANLVMPCEVTGSEDFNWEEPYVFGGWSRREYEKLKKTQPAHTDRFQLLSIHRDADSEWKLYDDDIAARVRRISDGKLFVLGLVELKVSDKNAPNYQLIDDYAVWFANNR